MQDTFCVLFVVVKDSCLLSRRTIHIWSSVGHCFSTKLVGSWVAAFFPSRRRTQNVGRPSIRIQIESFGSIFALKTLFILKYHYTKTKLKTCIPGCVKWKILHFTMWAYAGTRATVHGRVRVHYVDLGIWQKSYDCFIDESDDSDTCAIAMWTEVM